MRASRTARSRAGTAVLAALAILELAGCVTAPSRPVRIVPWAERLSRLAALDPFELTGRVAVAAGRQGFDARLTWRQSGERSTIDLNGPFGIGGVHVVSDGASLDVETSRGRSLTPAEARAQLTAKLGFEPPIGSLRYWLLGIPDPAGASSRSLDPEQRLTALRQYGWQIEYLAYVDAGGFSLPQRMALTRGDVRVRLFIDHWHP